jgi:glycosyltransferase involved in cell wall biosynthesis
VHNPEAVLGSYDVVFALGRAALEAMAVGAAVIVCHTEGLGEMVTPSSFERLQHRNFGRSLLSRPATADLIAGELQRYDAAVAAKVRDRVRAEATLAVAMDRILGIYARVASDFPGPLPVAAERTALHRYHQWHARAVRLGLQEPLSEATQRLAEAHARSQDEARRGLALADRVRAVESSLAWRLAQAADRVPGVPNLHRLLRRVAPWLWKPRE